MSKSGLQTCNGYVENKDDLASIFHTRAPQTDAPGIVLDDSQIENLQRSLRIENRSRLAACKDEYRTSFLIMT
ncbi:hypothetical protein DPMN_129665 [Dreissena polymorpha]|uniref:Uncharacterized protein n=1 Tax=Dreissena polymorpha TaxID=45954 RepID=A0A9D4H1K7_DREPO|nr:hypothetical protein DPMN_129665 [Dreissena polymorpha]